MIIIINKKQISLTNCFLLPKIGYINTNLNLINSKANCHKELMMYHLLNRVLPQAQATLPTLQSNHLFALSKEIRIQHEGEEYRLRLTRNNRLILTK